MRIITFFLLMLIPTALSQSRDQPRGPWRLAFKVVSGKWDSGLTGTATFWELFTSSNTYQSGNPLQDTRDFTTASDHYKSSIVEDWENRYISVQAIKLSFYKNNQEQAYVVFDGIGKSKSTWFKCDNILYSSFNDLPDATLGETCPGQTSTGFPLTIMKLSFLQAPCTMTTGWIMVADTNLGFSICTNYAPYDGSTPKPYFKYSQGSGLANMLTGLETADSIAIFFQVWDIAFKGVRGVQPSEHTLKNLTGLFLSTITENDNSNVTIRNLLHVTNLQLSGTAPTYKSGVIDLWEDYFIETAKFSMLENSVEMAYVVFNAVDTTKTSWFDDDTILYSSFGTDALNTAMDVCAIEGDTYRHWQIQSVADESGCSDAEQLGWMLVKEPKNNGSCAWDVADKKPYFLYNSGSTATNPSNFQYADVMAVFVHGWRIVLKVPAGTGDSAVSSVYDLWSQTGSLNEHLLAASDVSSGAPYFKSPIVDQWDNTTIHAVKLAAYKNGLEVFHAVFDATGVTNNVDWLSCDRLLYTSVDGFNFQSASQYSYSCVMNGSPFRFFLGTNADCGTVSFTGVFALIDKDNTCSTRTDLPAILYSNTLNENLSDTSSDHEADSFAIFFDMDNCHQGLCYNGGTCQDLGGNYRCFCAGSYYGSACLDLDGWYTEWSEWAACSVSCGDGMVTRDRTCEGTEGSGICADQSSETDTCVLTPCPIDGGFTLWTSWSECTLSCGSGSQTRTRACTDPEPQYEGNPCEGDHTETIDCNTHSCPINGGLTEWSVWGSCTHSCGTGTEQRTRFCTNPVPQYGGQDCVGAISNSRSCNIQECPIDGGFSNWISWATCTNTCGTGSQTRSRSCDSPVPQHGGLECSGPTLESQNCNTNPCPINGAFSDWSDWDACTDTCGSGSQSRSRSCSNPEPQHGGNDCTGVRSETQDCNTDPCPVNGGFTEWSEWDTCTLACGSGSQTRSRSCSSPAPQHGGQECNGTLSEVQDCNTHGCPVHGGYTEWSTWAVCSLICGSGSQARSRSCTNPEPQYGGNDCVGEDTETQDCNTHTCPIDGGYTQWTEWSVCTVACGTGSQSRSRTCTDPEPQYGGNDCTGQPTDSQLCNTHFCPIDGDFTEWSPWSDCSLICGTGSQSRSRSCTNPAPQYGGDECLGLTDESQGCNTEPCPVNGGLTAWGDWNTCTATCGGGEQTRARTCTNPVPQHGGSDCQGTLSESQYCNTENCPINGGLTAWNDWNTCTATCGGGEQTRARTCTNPVPQHGGSDCQGTLSESQDCNTENCPVNGGLTAWGDWNTCTATCGGGEETRARTCTNPGPQHGGSDCQGTLSESQDCNTENCPINGGLTAWNDWNTCTATCGGGEQTRARTCTNPVPQHGGSDCQGTLSESQYCNTENCPINGGLTAWNDWNTCTATCGGGEQTRARTCTNPVPQHGGNDCQGTLSESQDCNTDNCPINGGLTAWGDWNTCTATCGGGEQTRARTCTNPVPQHGGSDCQGTLSESQDCNTDNCPIDGGYTMWSEWGACSVSCGTGSQSRSRSCSSPSPQYGGSDCDGSESESQPCNTNLCPVTDSTAISTTTTDSTVTSTTPKDRITTSTSPTDSTTTSTTPTDSTSTSKTLMDSTTTSTTHTDSNTTSTTATDSTVTSTTATDSSTTSTTPTESTTTSTTPTDSTTSSRTATDSTVTSMTATDSSTTSTTPTDSTTTSTTPTDSSTTSTTPTDRTATSTTPTDSTATSTTPTDSTTISTTPTDSTTTSTTPTDSTATSTTPTDSTTTSTTPTDSTTTSATPTDSITTSTTPTDSSTTSTTPTDSTSTSTTLMDSTTTSTTHTDSNTTSTTLMDSTTTSTTHTDNTTTSTTLMGSTTTSTTPTDSSTTSTTLMGSTTTSTTPTDSTTTSTTLIDSTTTSTTPTDSTTTSTTLMDSTTTSTTPTDSSTTSTTPMDSTTTSTTLIDSTTSSTTPTDSTTTSMTATDSTVTSTTPTDSTATSTTPTDSTTTSTTLMDSTATSTTPTDSTATSTTPTDSTTTSTTPTDSTTTSRTPTDSTTTSTTPTDSTTTSTTPTDSTTTTTTPTDSTTTSMTPTDSTTTSTTPTDSTTTTTAPTDSTTTSTTPTDSTVSSTTLMDSTSTSTTLMDSTTTSTTPTDRTITSATPTDSTTTSTTARDSATTSATPTDSTTTNTTPADSTATSTTPTDSTATSTTPTDITTTSTTLMDSTATSTIPTDSSNTSTTPTDSTTTSTTAADYTVTSTTPIDTTTTRMTAIDSTATSTTPEDSTTTSTPTDSTATSTTATEEGVFSDWSDWTACPVSCGSGSETRARSCISGHCLGVLSDSRMCGTQLCPVDGDYTNWEEWQVCTTSCGTGSRQRSRSCTNPTPQNGGADCTGSDTEQETCYTQPCPIDGGLNTWSDWSECSVTCETGFRIRSRSCTNPMRQHGGSDCAGPFTDTEFCTIEPACPIDGGLTEWSDWNSCSATCATGSRQRSRSCTSPAPQNGGADCIDPYTESETCSDQPCPINGGLTEWADWSECLVTCGIGTRERSRTCTNPVPEHGGTNCDDPYTETQNCTTQPCPIDGDFSTWSDWSFCSVTCGGGQQSRSRSCANPEPQSGGNDCNGPFTDTQSCNGHSCPIDGAFTEWSEWTDCSQSCGVGSTIRYRTCTNPLPQYGGIDCDGSVTEVQSCILVNCPVDGGLTPWSVWDECTKSGDTGVQFRSRSCTNPAPLFGGIQCQGTTTESQGCNTHLCPIHGGFTEWSPWQQCSATCDTGSQIRVRACSNPEPQHGGIDCVGTNYESRECVEVYCPVGGYFTDWSNWSPCTVTCQTGIKTRTRTCVGPFHGGPGCEGDTTNTDTCNTDPCPVDGYWLDWSDWTVCTATCHGGISVRVRECVQPQYGGKQCQGTAQDLAVCGETPCPKVDGQWTDWSEWTSCSQTCGTGYRARSRSCAEPVPQWGGADCPGNHTDSQNCVLSYCPVDGIWSTWQSWWNCYNMTSADCDTNCDCGYGVTGRNRTCTNPPPENGGQTCNGESSQAKNCFVPCLKVQCDVNHPQYCQVQAPPKSARYSDANTEKRGKTSTVLYVLLVRLLFVWFVD